MEGRIPSETALAIPKKRLPRRRRQQLELENDGYQAIALCDQQPKPVEFGSLLKTAVAMGGNDDPLEELRRRIKRTRAKMDSQNQVMNSFLSDVNQMKQLDRSFSSAELSTPRSDAGGTPALTAGPKAPALCGSSSCTALAMPGRGPAPRPGSANANARGLSLRSDAASNRRLGESRSQPALTAAAMGSLHNQSAPLALPPRRAPPGAPGTEFQKAISSAGAARRRALAANAACTTGGGESVASRRLSSIGGSQNRLVAA